MSNRGNRFAAFLRIVIPGIAVLFGACRHAGEPSGNSSASKPATTNSSAAGDFEGTIAFRMETESRKDMEMTYFLKGRNTRVETKLSNVPEGQAVMLWDLETGKITTLIPQRRMYMTLDMKSTAEGIKDLAKDMKKPAPDDSEFPKLTATGQQETVAGHTCEHFLMGEHQEVDMCVAKGLGYFGMGGQTGGGDIASFKNLIFSPKLLAEAASHPEWVKLLEGGAFPLKIRVTDEGKVKMSMEATRIERRSLDSSLFAVPADYKEMTIPAAPAGRQ